MESEGSKVTTIKVDNDANSEVNDGVEVKVNGEDVVKPVDGISDKVEATDSEHGDLGEAINFGDESLDDDDDNLVNNNTNNADANEMEQKQASERSDSPVEADSGLNKEEDTEPEPVVDNAEVESETVKVNDGRSIL